MDSLFRTRFDEVRALYEREQALRPIAREIRDIPVAYELISSEWLTQAICPPGSSARVVEHSLDTVDEGTSSRRRIFLTYNDAGKSARLPASVFCKSTQGLANRFALGLNEAAWSEVHFYKHVRPLCEDIEAPVGLFANFDSRSLNSIVILEDLRGRAEFCDYNTCVSLDMAERQVGQLAKLHGRFDEDSKLHAAVLPIQTLEEFFDKTDKTIDWVKSRLRGLAAAREVLPQRLRGRDEEIEQATEKSIRAHAQLPRTLLHDDCHLRNWYVTSEGEMGLSDWQILARGNGIRDLAYAISTSLDVESRRAWEKHLVALYLDQLSAQGARTPSFDDAFRLYRQQMPCALANWTSTLDQPPGTPEMQPPKASMEFIKRITHAMDDLDSLNAF